MSKSVYVGEEAHRTMVDIHQVDHPLKPAARASYPPKNNLKMHRRSMIEPQGQLSQAGVSAFSALSNVVDNVVGALGFVVRLNGPDKSYAINGIQAHLNGEAAISRIDLQTKEGKKSLVSMESKEKRK